MTNADKIKTVLLNHNIMNNDQIITDFDNNSFEFDIYQDVSAEQIIKIQNDLPDFTITLSGAYDGIVLSFDFKE